MHFILSYINTLVYYTILKLILSWDPQLNVYLPKIKNSGLLIVQIFSSLNDSSKK